jgi:hypothetical protein
MRRVFCETRQLSDEQKVNEGSYHAVHLVEEFQGRHVTASVGLAQRDGAVEPALLARLVGPSNVLLCDGEERDRSILGTQGCVMILSIHVFKPAERRTGDHTVSREASELGINLRARRTTELARRVEGTIELGRVRLECR